MAQRAISATGDSPVAHRFALALWCCGGDRVVSWGHCSEVRDELRNVQQVQASSGGAFAAVLADASVVAWGHPD